MGNVGGWELLGRVSPGALGPARLTLHWAAQIVAAVGSTLIDARPDWSHTALGWIESPERGLAGEPLAGGTRAFLADGLVWLAGAVARQVGSPERPLARPVHELPPSPVGDGAPFEVEPEALAELSSWYANASRLLADVARATGASPVRCWPHHFDIATLLRLGEGSGEEARSIGVGLSPGDGSYAEPYWYVTPWPYPKEKEVPSLALGHWHTTGWFGAVLTASELGADPAAQESITRSFVQSAIAASRQLLG
jgi:hypothetical protein